MNKRTLPERVRHLDREAVDHVRLHPHDALHRARRLGARARRCQRPEAIAGRCGGRPTPLRWSPTAPGPSLPRHLVDSQSESGPTRVPKAFRASQMLSSIRHAARACPAAAGAIRTMMTEPKRSQRGLFHGRTVGFGNNVSFSHRRTEVQAQHAARALVERGIRHSRTRELSASTLSAACPCFPRADSLVLHQLPGDDGGAQSHRSQGRARQLLARHADEANQLVYRHGSERADRVSPSAARKIT